MMPSKGMFDDFCDRVVQYGYLVLFAPAFPLAPFLAFINNVIEIRTSGERRLPHSSCSKCRLPSKQNGPNHLGLCWNALPTPAAEWP